MKRHIAKYLNSDFDPEEAFEKDVWEEVMYENAVGDEENRLPRRRVHKRNDITTVLDF